tara:strand:- start:6219 stop:6626 length:408 start_codon:yes stop_codon:yes gene_type:complete
MEYFTLLDSDYWTVKVINTPSTVAKLSNGKRTITITPDKTFYDGTPPNYQLRLDVYRLANRLQLEYDIHIDESVRFQQLKRMLLRWSPTRMTYPDFKIQEDEAMIERAILSFLAEVNDLDLYSIYEQYKKTMTWL